MNKYILCLVVAFAAPVFAASTCRQQVDKNLDKSVPAKVDLCLNPPIHEVGAATAPRIIYTDVQQAVPVDEANSSGQESATPYTPASVVVRHQYVEQLSLPPFKNDVPPQAKNKPAETTLTERSVKKEQKPARKLTKAAKPARKTASKLSPVAPSQPIDSMADTPVDKSAVPTGTPAEELAQAQALQQDPLSTNYTDGGAAPQGFVQDDLMTSESFGHINTDPAFQP